jgi:hypothetical protein
MTKVICIFVDESHRLPLTLNHFYMAFDTVGRIVVENCFIYNEDRTLYYGVYEKEHFMTLAECREQQIKIVLDE